MPTIYVIECQDSRYFVGKTGFGVDHAFAEHLIGNGGEWTRVFEPMGIMESFESNDPSAEMNKVKELMRLHGIDNVRGGMYLKFNMDDYQVEALSNELSVADRGQVVNIEKQENRCENEDEDNDSDLEEERQELITRHYDSDSEENPTPTQQCHNSDLEEEQEQKPVTQQLKSIKQLKMYSSDDSDSDYEKVTDKSDN